MRAIECPICTPDTQDDCHTCLGTRVLYVIDKPSTDQIQNFINRIWFDRVTTLDAICYMQDLVQGCSHLHEMLKMFRLYFESKERLEASAPIMPAALEPPGLPL